MKEKPENCKGRKTEKNSDRKKVKENSRKKDRKKKERQKESPNERKNDRKKGFQSTHCKSANFCHISVMQSLASSVLRWLST